MKIGILSMQRVINYGSFLQAYSLKKNLEALGNNVVFVDYNVHNDTVESIQIPFYKRLTWDMLLKRIIPKRRRAAKAGKQFVERFENEFFEWLGLSKQNNFVDKVDTLIIGSDEVFRCIETEDGKGELCSELLGNYPEADRIVTYAASAGNTTIKSIENKLWKKDLKKYLSCITHISVRDDNTEEFVRAFVEKPVLHHLDPVFIYDYHYEIPRVSIAYKYILMYGYNNRFTHEEIKEIKRIARKEHLKILSCGAIQYFADINIAADPFELLAYVKNAEYVITDTFHGTVFSIKFEKQFATIVRATNNHKVLDLLKRTKCESRTCNDISAIEELLHKKIDYSQTRAIIEEYRQSAYDYLKKISAGE